MDLSFNKYFVFEKMNFERLSNISAIDRFENYLEAIFIENICYRVELNF